jgi:hypothetical protein
MLDTLIAGVRSSMVFSFSKLHLLLIAVRALLLTSNARRNSGGVCIRTEPHHRHRLALRVSGASGPFPTITPTARRGNAQSATCSAWSTLRTCSTARGCTCACLSVVVRAVASSLCSCAHSWSRSLHTSSRALRLCSCALLPVAIIPLAEVVVYPPPPHTHTHTHTLVAFHGRYPNGTLSERRAIRAAHVNYTLGLLWFWASDPAAGDALHSEMASVGFCNDE